MTKRTSIAILDYPGAQAAAVHGLQDVLQSAARLEAQASKRAPRLDVEVLRGATPPAPERSLSAVVLPPSLNEAPPSGVPEPLAAWIRARSKEGTTLCSVCVGAFVLAEIGLLDGRPATTHWALREVFAARFPKVALDTDRLIVDDGDIVTAGGLMAWVDLSLRLVERYLGPSAMLSTARMFLVDPGGREQRFYSSTPLVFTHGDDAILRVQRWLQRRLGEPVTVAQMTKVAKLGERTFLRRFQRATGMKTSEYLQHLRVGRARELLEQSAAPLQEVAWGVGYEDPRAFRRTFVKLMGLSPGEYRRRFGSADRRSHRP